MRADLQERREAAFVLRRVIIVPPSDPPRWSAKDMCVGGRSNLDALETQETGACDEDCHVQG